MSDEFPENKQENISRAKYKFRNENTENPYSSSIQEQGNTYEKLSYFFKKP